MSALSSAVANNPFRVFLSIGEEYVSQDASNWAVDLLNGIATHNNNNNKGERASKSTDFSKNSFHAKNNSLNRHFLNESWRESILSFAVVLDKDRDAWDDAREALDATEDDITHPANDDVETRELSSAGSELWRLLHSPDGTPSLLLSDWRNVFSRLEMERSKICERFDGVSAEQSNSGNTTTTTTATSSSSKQYTWNTRGMLNAAIHYHMVYASCESVLPMPQDIWRTWAEGLAVLSRLCIKKVDPKETSTTTTTTATSSSSSSSFNADAVRYVFGLLQKDYSNRMERAFMACPRSILSQLGRLSNGLRSPDERARLVSHAAAVMRRGAPNESQEQDGDCGDGDQDIRKSNSTELSTLADVRRAFAPALHKFQFLCFEGSHLYDVYGQVGESEREWLSDVHYGENDEEGGEGEDEGNGNEKDSDNESGEHRRLSIVDSAFEATMRMSYKRDACVAHRQLGSSMLEAFTEFEVDDKKRKPTEQAVHRMMRSKWNAESKAFFDRVTNLAQSSSLLDSNCDESSTVERITDADADPLAAVLQSAYLAPASGGGAPEPTREEVENGLVDPRSSDSDDESGGGGGGEHTDATTSQTAAKRSREDRKVKLPSNGFICDPNSRSLHFVLYRMAELESYPAVLNPARLQYCLVLLQRFLCSYITEKNKGDLPLFPSATVAMPTLQGVGNGNENENAISSIDAPFACSELEDSKKLNSSNTTSSSCTFQADIALIDYIIAVHSQLLKFAIATCARPSPSPPPQKHESNVNTKAVLHTAIKRPRDDTSTSAAAVESTFSSQSLSRDVSSSSLSLLLFLQSMVDAVRSVSLSLLHCLQLYLHDLKRKYEKRANVQQEEWEAKEKYAMYAVQRWISQVALKQYLHGLLKTNVSHSTRTAPLHLSLGSTGTIQNIGVRTRVYAAASLLSAQLIVLAFPTTTRRAIISTGLPNGNVHVHEWRMAQIKTSLKDALNNSLDWLDQFSTTTTTTTAAESDTSGRDAMIEIVFSALQMSQEHLLVVESGIESNTHSSHHPNDYSFESIDLRTYGNIQRHYKELLQFAPSQSCVERVTNAMLALAAKRSGSGHDSLLAMYDNEYVLQQNKRESGNSSQFNNASSPQLPPPPPLATLLDVQEERRRALKAFRH